MLTLSNHFSGSLVLSEATINRVIREAVDLETLKLPVTVEEIRVSCQKGKLVLCLLALKMGMKFEAQLPVLTLTPEINTAQQLIRLKTEGHVTLTGRNIGGSMGAVLAQGKVNREIASPETASLISEKTNGLVSLAWPQATIDLGKLPQVRELLAMKVMGVSLLEALQVSAIQVEDGALRIKFSLPTCLTDEDGSWVRVEAGGVTM